MLHILFLHSLSRRERERERKQASYTVTNHNEIFSMLSSRTMRELYQYVSTLYLVPWCGRVSPLIAGKKWSKCMATSSGQAVGMWVAQELQEIGLLVALEDDTVRDLYWCVVLNFMCDLYLLRPSRRSWTDRRFTVQEPL